VTRSQSKSTPPLGVRAIARAMRIARQQIVDGDPESRPLARQMHAHCCRELADEFTRRSSRFNRGAFFGACGASA
jgi:hypothetical protein